jgi:acylphosphatase
MPGVFTNVGIEQDGRLDVFILGSNTSQPDINIWHNVQTAPNSGWNGWYFLQYGSVFIGKPAVARNWDGRLEVFARSTDKNIWHIWQTAPGGPWSTWQKLQNGSSFNGDPAVVQNKDGRLEVFARGNDNNIWHIWQTRPADDTSWFTWQYMEKGSSFSGDPAVGMDTDGRVEVFAVGTDSTMWVNYQQSAGGSWSTWVPLPRSPATNGFIGTPAVARNADGHLEIFAR